MIIGEEKNASKQKLYPTSVSARTLVFKVDLSIQIEKPASVFFCAEEAQMQSEGLA